MNNIQPITTKTANFIKQTFLPPYRLREVPVILGSLVLLILMIFTVYVARNQSNVNSHADTANSAEVENGITTGNVTIISDANASGGEYAKFGPQATPTPTPLVRFIGFHAQQVNHVVNGVGFGGQPVTSNSNGSFCCHTAFPNGGSPQTQQKLNSLWEASTDYLQVHPWPAVIGSMFNPWMSGPAQTGLSNNVAALYYGNDGAPMAGGSGGYPMFEEMLNNPASLTNLPVPAGTWHTPVGPNGTAPLAAVPMITWHLGSTSLADIAAGKYDASTLIPDAQMAKRWPASPGDPAYPGQPGGQVLIRLMHEFNGNWAAYCPCSTGETTTDFVNAWRHIVEVFRAQGATNVRWVWAPNIASSGPGTTGPSPWNTTSGTTALMYPGDNYVDYVGLDGYNKSVPSWRTFAQTFVGSYNWIYKGDAYTNGPITTTKPMILTEIGSLEFSDGFTGTAQTKAQWINDIMTVVPQQMPNVVGLLIWQADSGDGIDFGATSSPATVTAWDALANSWNGRVPLIKGVTQQ